MPASTVPQALAGARVRVANALELVAPGLASQNPTLCGRKTVDAERHIAWPPSVTFSLSPRQRAAGRSLGVAAMPPKPVSRRRLIVARVMLAYASLYAIGGVVYHVGHLRLHELAAAAIALRALVPFAQIRENRRYVGRLQLSNVPDATMTLDLDDAGLRMSGDTNATYAWDEIASVDYHEPFYRVNVPRRESLLVPRSAFSDGGRQFATAIEARFVSTYLLRKPSQGASVLVNAHFQRRS